MKDLTIIIPAYKAEPYLVPCVESALRCPGAQIIIADNCSPDSTLAIAKSFEQEHPEHLSVIARPENIGMTANWQRTMEQVKTPLALNFSADDILCRSYVEAATAFMHNHPEVGMVSARAHIVDAAFGLDGKTPAEDTVTQDDFHILHGLDAARYALHWDPFPACPSTIFRKQFWAEVGGFDLALRVVPDREIWFRIGRKYSVAHCDKMGVHYRLHSANETSATWRNDRWCYEYSHMFRRAKTVWPERELRPLFRHAFLINAKAYAGSSWRALKRGKLGEIPFRMGRGFSDLWQAIT